MDIGLVGDDGALPDVGVAADVVVGLEALQIRDPVWEETLNKRVIPAVLSIRTMAVRWFDTERQRTSQASGFIVDAEMGIILTNRHVVTPGPGK